MFNLAINTGFAVNRYVEPESWVPIVGKKLGLKRVQLTADLINPVLPDKTIQSQLVRIKEASEKILFSGECGWGSFRKKIVEGNCVPEASEKKLPPGTFGHYSQNDAIRWL